MPADAAAITRVQRVTWRDGLPLAAPGRGPRRLGRRRGHRHVGRGHRRHRPPRGTGYWWPGRGPRRSASWPTGLPSCSRRGLLARGAVGRAGRPAGRAALGTSGTRQPAAGRRGRRPGDDGGPPAGDLGARGRRRDDGLPGLRRLGSRRVDPHPGGGHRHHPPAALARAARGRGAGPRSGPTRTPRPRRAAGVSFDRLPRAGAGLLRGSGGGQQQVLLDRAQGRLRRVRPYADAGAGGGAVRRVRHRRNCSGPTATSGSARTRRPYKTHQGAVLHPEGAGTGAWYVRGLRRRPARRRRQLAHAARPGRALPAGGGRRPAGSPAGRRRGRPPERGPVGGRGAARAQPRGVTTPTIPRMELLRHKSIHAGRHWTPEDWLDSREVLDRVRKTWRALVPAQPMAGRQRGRHHRTPGPPPLTRPPPMHGEVHGAPRRRRASGESRRLRAAATGGPGMHETGPQQLL